MLKQNLLVALAAVVVLAIVAASPIQAKERAEGAEKAENCSLKGTWYGYNTHGAVWIVTITRSGPGTYSIEMDSGANPVYAGTTGGTNFRGELVKTGAKKYDFTTMAFFPIEEGFGIPYTLGYCPLTAKKTGCHTWEGKGVCAPARGFFHGQDPFVDGFPVVEGEGRLKVYFRRMPVAGAASD